MSAKVRQLQKRNRRLCERYRSQAMRGRSKTQQARPACCAWTTRLQAWLPVREPLKESHRQEKKAVAAIVREMYRGLLHERRRSARTRHLLGQRAAPAAVAAATAAQVGTRTSSNGGPVGSGGGGGGSGGSGDCGEVNSGAAGIANDIGSGTTAAAGAASSEDAAATSAQRWRLRSVLRKSTHCTEHAHAKNMKNSETSLAMQGTSRSGRR